MLGCIVCKPEMQIDEFAFAVIESFEDTLKKKKAEMYPGIHIQVLDCGPQQHKYVYRSRIIAFLKAIELSARVWNCPSVKRAYSPLLTSPS